MYHPERFSETVREVGRGFYKFTDKISPYFLPHIQHEIFEDPPRIYTPKLLKVFTGIAIN